MQRIASVDLPAQYGPDRAGDVRDSQADISRTQRDLGFEPAIGFEEGLRRTLDWLRAEKQG